MPSGEIPLYCDYSPTLEIEYDIDGDATPADVVIEALSTVTDADPMEMKPLDDYVDVDALNRLLTRQGKGTERESTVVSFTVGELVVFVRNDGHIVVCDVPDPLDRIPIFDRADTRTDFPR